MIPDFPEVVLADGDRGASRTAGRQHYHAASGRRDPQRQAAMTVSVIIPVHNGARFLGRALDSALRQTRPPAEIIVIDDGSTDDSAAVARSYGASVHLLTQPNQGPAVARNVGLAAATGELIAFLDADDWWERDKLERQVEFLDSHPEVGLVHTATTFVDATGQPLSRPNAAYKPRLQGRCLAALLAGNRITASSVVVRRSALGGYVCDPTLLRASDWDLWLKVAMNSSFGYIDEPLTGYQFHGANISLDSEAVLIASATVIQRALERGLPADAARFARRSERRHLLTLGHLYYDEGRWAEARGAFLKGWAFREDGNAAVRCLATLLPTGVHGRVRKLWQQLTASRGATKSVTYPD